MSERNAMGPNHKSFRLNLPYALLLSAFLIFPYLTYIHYKRVQPSQFNQLLAAYDPIIHSATAQSRIHHQCHVRLPTEEQLKEYPFSDWSLSRFAAYYNIYYFLKSHWNTTVKPNVLDFGGSSFLAPFNRSIQITKTKYPDVDIHHTDFPSNFFDAVAADQVLEHTMFPHLAMLELRRILKPGGIAMITTVAYNPLHESTGFHDYWRFMLDGLLLLSIPFEGGVKNCGSWGSAQAVAVRAAHGMGSPIEKSLHYDGRKDELKNNDPVNPFLVWLVVQK